MARKTSQSDPALEISFFNSGFYTYRSQLFAPFKGIGVNVVQFKDPVLDGSNFECTDLFQWTRRPGFSRFCPTQLGDTEIVNQFYSSRNLNGQVTAFFDSTTRFGSFTNAGLLTILAKSTTQQGYATTVGNMTYFSDGASADLQKWGSPNGSQAAPQLSAWGLAGPNTAPTVSNIGCWLPSTIFNSAYTRAILDPNGNVQLLTAGDGYSGTDEPLWSTTLLGVTSDGQVSWTNYGPILAWLPSTYYPVPAVVLDSNGNLQLAAPADNPIPEYDSGATYAVGDTVEFGGVAYTATAPSTGVAPNPNSTLTSGGSTISYWITAVGPLTTGATAPTWNPAITGTTPDGTYLWTNIGQGTLIETVGTSYVYGFRTIYGHLTTCSPVSVNTGAIFGPQAASITAYDITNSATVIFTGTNNMIPRSVLAGHVAGNVFTVRGLTTPVGLLLNNRTFRVTAATPTTFTAVITGGASLPVTPTTSDAGYTVDMIAEVVGPGMPLSPLLNSFADITGILVSGNIVTIYATNNFVPGLYVSLTALTVATYLNNQLPLQVINVDPLGTWFQVYFVAPNASLAADTGLATFCSVEIYRVSDGGGIYLFAGAEINPGSGPLTFWGHYDVATDGELDILQIAPQNGLNDPPPGAPGVSNPVASSQVGTITVYWGGRLWMVVGNYVYFNAGPDCVNGIPEESWPGANRFQYAGPVLALKPTPDEVGLLVYLADRVCVILGGPETIAFYTTDTFSNFGIANPNAIFRDGSTIGQFTTQKQYVELVEKTKLDIGEHVGDYLSANFNPTTTYATLHRNGLDVGAFLSNGVDQVLRYGTNIQAWSVPAFPVGGAGALQSIETSVGVYSLMLASPTGGGYLLARDLTVWQDGGTPGGSDGTNYDECFITIGSITLSQPGAPLFPLQHIVGYFDAVGTLGSIGDPNGVGPSNPHMWILPNEVSGTSGIGFIELPEVVQEPPVGQNNPSTTIQALRWNVNMMNSSLASQYVHHLQVRIEFLPENAPNTIKAIAFKEFQNE